MEYLIWALCFFAVAGLAAVADAVAKRFGR